MRLFCTLALFVCALPASVGAQNLEFCYDPYPPYSLGTEGPSEGGLKVKLLQEVVARIDGITASVSIMPWARCQAEVANGNLDGILPLFPNAERAEYMVFSDDTFSEASVFWYSRERFPDGLTWSGHYQDFDGMSLGLLNGSYIEDGLEPAFSQTQEILRAPNIPALFLMIEHGRVDLIATDAAVGRYNAQATGDPERFARVERPIAERASRFGLSKVTGAAAHLGAFNAAIAELHAEGRIDEILNGDP